MKSYTAHLKFDREPILVAEGWSTAAFVFGPVWLAINRAWIPAALHLAILVLIAALLPAPAKGVVTVALAVLAGLMGRDLVRWSLDRRGYLESHVLAARNEEAALGRLLTYRPDIAASLAATLR